MAALKSTTRGEAIEGGLATAAGEAQHSDQVTSPRWTPHRIRRAVALPKPRGALSAMHDYEMGRLVGRPKPTPLELRLLEHIATNADLLDVPRETQPARRKDPDGWLLVPAPQWLIDALAEFGAESEDDEVDEDREADFDNEESDPDGGDDCDREADGLRVTDAQRALYRNSTEALLLRQAGGFRPLPRRGSIDHG